MASGELVALDDSVGEIDTSDQLTMVSAFQKVFIANGSNLKVADFINTKIATTDVGSHAPDFGTELEGETSGAKMIVDYITATSGACTIYGYRTTTETFETEDVSGTDDDDNSISFTTSGVETSSPHWYGWTVFGADATTYGTMPVKAYLIAIYRGRVVLAGNPEYPHQWYMSRVASPFNFLYGEDDALSAVAGNNADAGQCPDIIRALIPFHDDYLIFGCASSIWILRGDPASSGSLDNLLDTTGVYGPTSWCFDDNRNLYFFGTGGIYFVSSDFSTVKNISADVLPELITDESADTATHRITMGFDKKRSGLIISVTVIATGVNSDYFYSLKTGGFYPETYPEECAPYSMFYYSANDPTLADLLVGCKDGYIRRFVDSAKSDDIGATNEAINAYVTLPVVPLAEDDYEGKLASIVFESAGGASSGALSDSDGFSYDIHFGDDAETVLEDIMDGATPKITGTVSGPGRTNKLRKKGRGAYMGIKIYNSTDDETFGINRILYDRKQGGRLR